MDLDESRQSSILDALQRYRHRVEALNVSLLRAAINETTSHPQPGNAGERAEATSKRHLQAITRDCFSPWDHDHFKALTSPSEFLEPWALRPLIRQYSLDGVDDHNPPNLPKREAWFTIIREAMTELELEQGKPRPEKLPDDLEYLCTLVDGLCGPGLPWWREHQQIDFISSISSGSRACESLEMSKTRVHKCPRQDPDLDWEAQSRIMTFDNWENWDISVAIQIGDAEFGEGASYALYCRRVRCSADEDGVSLWDEGVESEDFWGEGDEVWKWRYGTHDGEWESKLYDSVEGFLEWYATCKEDVMRR